MRRAATRPLRIALALVLLLAAPPATSPVAAGSDRLPDLRMATLSQFSTETSGGERRLRFRTIMTNEGTGPLEVRGRRDNLSQPHLRTQQAIHDGSGNVRLVNSRALMEYAEDGHDHWHIQGVMLYQMWSANGAVRRGTKVGFCFLDSYRFNLSMPGAPQSQVYPERFCGDRGDLTNRMGLSVGWGDDYPANFAFQWIDITTLPPGDYTVQARADEQNWYLESNETNNCAYARVRITASNGPVQVLGSGRSCQVPPASTARVERQYGNNRYETAAAASEDAFAPGVPVAYVATGANFPDALAAGAAAGFQRGPVVLVERNFLPALATTELERLNPQRIVIVGGTTVISEYVASALDAYDTGGGVLRLAGADRYATAAVISRHHHPSGAPMAYVATGLNFPDALAAGPAAAIRGAPTILVRATGVPGASATELERLNPTRIIVLGGPRIVNQTVFGALGAYADG